MITNAHQANTQRHSKKNTNNQAGGKRGRMPFPRDENNNIIRPDGWRVAKRRKTKKNADDNMDDDNYEYNDDDNDDATEDD